MRSGEELDAERLKTYLATQWGRPVADVAVEQFPQGFSNLTYLVRSGGEEFVLRRPPFGNQVKSAHDMGREFNVLSKLSRVYELAPKPVLRAVRPWTRARPTSESFQSFRASTCE